MSSKDDGLKNMVAVKLFQYAFVILLIYAFQFQGK